MVTKHSRTRPRGLGQAFSYSAKGTRPSILVFGQGDSAKHSRIQPRGLDQVLSESAKVTRPKYSWSRPKFTWPKFTRPKFSCSRPKFTRPCCFSYLIRPFDSESAHSDSASLSRPPYPDLITMIRPVDTRTRPGGLGHDTRMLAAVACLHAT